MKQKRTVLTTITALILLASLAAACSPAAPDPAAEAQEHDEEGHSTGETGEAYLSHPDDLSAVNIPSGGNLQVVATTSILADVVSNVGGDRIELTGLFPLGSDPHTYEPTPADYQTMVNADVILISGVGLEEFLEPTLAQIASETPVLSLSEGINLLEFGQASHEGEVKEGEAEHEGEVDESEAEPEHSHEAGYDPHVWFDPNNVIQWVHNTVEIFTDLDPAHAETYLANGEEYISQLTELDEWINQETGGILPEDRELVTDHMAFSYFASRYDFDMIGAVIPAYSTSAEPSAQELAALIDSIRELNVQAIFVGVSANASLAEQAAADTGVRLLPLFTGSLSDNDGPAATYLELMRYNVNAIVSGLSGS